MHIYLTKYDLLKYLKKYLSFCTKMYFHLQNVYYQSPRNPNLIAIVPVDEPSPLQPIEAVCPGKVEKTESSVEPCSQGERSISL